MGKKEKQYGSCPKKTPPSEARATSNFFFMEDEKGGRGWRAEGDPSSDVMLILWVLGPGQIYTRVFLSDAAQKGKKGSKSFSSSSEIQRAK